MYTGAILFGAGCAALAGTWLSAAMVLARIVVRVAKSQLEERWMAELHPDYMDCCRRTWRFVPWLFQAWPPLRGTPHFRPIDGDNRVMLRRQRSLPPSPSVRDAAATQPIKIQNYII